MGQQEREGDGTTHELVAGERLLGRGAAFPVPLRAYGSLELDAAGEPGEKRRARALLLCVPHDPAHGARGARPPEVLPQVREVLGSILRARAVEDRAQALLRIGRRCGQEEWQVASAKACLAYSEWATTSPGFSFCQKK